MEKTPASLVYPILVFNKNSTLKTTNVVKGRVRITPQGAKKTKMKKL